MYRNIHQEGYFTLLNCATMKPLQGWDVKTRNGKIEKLTDDEIQSVALEIVEDGERNPCITFPSGVDTLGVTFPFLVLNLKDLKRNFTLEVLVLDDKDIPRLLRLTNYQPGTLLKKRSGSHRRRGMAVQAIHMVGDWYQHELDLVDLVKKAFKTKYKETLKVRVSLRKRV
ncbi:cilia- and flagella-associated protein 20 [Nephila pilipes]|uniref:Cilia- and flagella-associated protein 20 n=1 Tax=Nephila pilipes TaxID=299642 RepID=A0A8X6QZH5_NEPPI|nr:cilia- and flagella-associated protein 20 [Nephila pilipes]